MSSSGSAASSKDFNPPGDRHSVHRKPSLNTFTSFTPSVMDLPNIVTQKDFHNSIATYKQLLTKAAALRTSLETVSHAANEFGRALEDTIKEAPKVVNTRTVCDGISNAGGLQYMIGSNQQILSRMIATNFEEPLAERINQLKIEYETNHTHYQSEIKAKSRLLREKEIENIKLSKLKTRNLNTYKNNLLHLTNHLDEIDRLKYDYYHEINSMIEKFNQDHLLIRTGSLVRAQLEIFEGIAKKGWSGGGLDELLAISPDLFEASYDSDDGASHHPYDDPTSKANNLTTDQDVDTLENDDEIQDYDETADTIRVTKPNNDYKPSESPSKLSRKLSTSLSNLLKGTENADTSLDESFSLPVVNQVNSLMSLRGKNNDNGEVDDDDNDKNNDNDDDEDQEIDNSHLLDGLNE